MPQESRAMTPGNTRDYDEVGIGDEIGPLERVISGESVLAFCKVWGSPMPNRFTDESTAKEVQLPGPIVPGIMSMALMAQLLTHWSPHGTLKRLDVLFRQPVLHGPVIISALVTDKREEGGEKLVECDIHMSNQDSGRLVGGTAVISLASPKS